ncbi:MAG: glutathione S-transferase family protein [Deltaproteobacteria bacterium]|nr:glutathione S-transferase family protein [Deltaproteobacteria bacterium]
MNPIKIFGFAGSTYVRTARAICVEKGLPHELVPLEFRAESHRARHPFLKMPAIEHEGQSFFETLAVGTYLDSLTATPALQPASTVQRATMMQWISVAIDYLYRDFVGALLADAIAEGATEIAARDLDILEQRLSKSPYLAGDTLSLADLFVAPMVAFAESKDARFAPRERVALKRWLGEMTSRESFKATAG